MIFCNYAVVHTVSSRCDYRWTEHCTLTREKVDGSKPFLAITFNQSKMCTMVWFRTTGKFEAICMYKNLNKNKTRKLFKAVVLIPAFNKV